VTGARSLKWWDRATDLNGIDAADAPDDEERRKRAWAWATGLEASDGEDRKSRANDALTLYFGTESHCTFDDTGSTLIGLGLMTEEVAEYNVIQACTDTMVSHLVRNKVRTMFVTEKGDSELKERALGMQQAVEGTFDEIGVYGMTGMELCGRGEILEGGVVKCSPDYANDRVDAQLCWAHEFFVSDREARANNIRQMAHVFDVDREVLLDQFKESGEETLAAIRDASPCRATAGQESGAGTGDSVSDRVKVIELWHLPSGRVDLDDPKSFGQHKAGEDIDPELDPGHDGRRMLILEHATLADEPWPYDHFFVARFLPRKKPGHAWSRGIPEVLASIQLAINKWARRLEGILNLHAVPRLIASRQANLNLGKLNNSYASVLECDGSPGNAIMRLDPNSVPADLVNRIERLEARAEKQIGLSELSIAATKPAGVDHAPGMQHLSDTESIRHTTSFRAWEQFHLDLAKIVVECFRLLAQRNADFTVVFGSNKELKKLNWRKIDLKRDQYKLKQWPTNLLPQTPAAKASRALDYLQAGLFTPQQALQVLDFPDIEAVMSDTTAYQKNIEAYLDRCRKAGRDLPADCIPNDYLDLAMAQQMAKNAINRAQADGENATRIDGLIAFFQLATQKLQEQQSAMAPPPPETAAPMGALPPMQPGAAGPGGGPPMPPAQAAPPMM
jgi:hypothetical protein